MLSCLSTSFCGSKNGADVMTNHVMFLLVCQGSSVKLKWVQTWEVCAVCVIAYHFVNVQQIIKCTS